MFIEALASVLVGPLVARVAAKRSQAQNVSFDVAAEDEVLYIAARRPDLTAVAVGAGMNEDSFTDPVRSRRWQEAAATATQRGLCTYTEETAAEFTPGDAEGERFVSSGETVLAAQLDRESYKGSLNVVRTEDTEKPLKFEARPVSVKRSAFAVAWCLAGFIVSAAATTAAFPFLALATLVVYGLVVTLVDFDTLFLDRETFAVGTLSTWLLATAALLTGQISSQFFLIGAIAATFWALAMKIVAAFFLKVRGVDGLGGGDLLIVIATTGIPVAITGSLPLAAHSMTATGVLAVVFVIARAVITRRSHREAFALGPFLAAGWMFALPVLQLMEML